MENAAFFMGGHAIDDVMWKAQSRALASFFFFFTRRYCPRGLSSGRVL